VREAFAALLRTFAELRIVGLASDFESIAVETRPALDGLLLVVLEDEESLEEIESLLAGEQRPHVVVVDATTDVTRAVRLLNAQVAGLVVQDDTPEDLLRVLLAAAAGQPALSAGVSELVERTADGWQAKSLGRSARRRLTLREREVLRLLAQGLTVRKCADRLGISPSTVDNHKTRMMRKLNVHKTIDLVRIATRHGWLRE
jgi:DNA-binding NarL/FixJ family response regulator